ncbi:MAG: NAD(P)-dependent oxidoreductase [Betaproteobacteria bacterium]
MKVLFRFDASAALARRVESLSGNGIDVACAPESDSEAYERFLPQANVIWHVLKPIDERQISLAPHLRLIQKIGSGVNTIDLEAAKKRGIAVCNLPGTNSRAVAEMTLLLMLACLRRLRDLDRSVRNAAWPQAWKLQDRFGELGGRSVGLVGYGAVPRILHPILEAMGASVLFWSRSQKNTELAALLAQSDIVSLHLPLTNETRNIVNPLQLRPGAILINTARGGLVDERQLLAALASGHLAAAGLDTFASEPLPAAHPLAGFDNVVLAPHLAWLTQETLARSIEAAWDNVRRLAEGRALANRVS